MNQNAFSSLPESIHPSLTDVYNRTMQKYSTAQRKNPLKVRKQKKVNTTNKVLEEKQIKKDHLNNKNKLANNIKSQGKQLTKERFIGHFVYENHFVAIVLISLLIYFIIE